ncbi:unnamed protein product [Angiostrongylus costaricensis]|uniref:Intraflagellar transport protein 43 homolog n=1 Tax=Angiostrongylus costaricensis TaxID=334426 RepID=A0A0R3Q2V0_ANGCS|nr:unnamed protein product [Angiostrongylus costaricensis]
MKNEKPHIELPSGLHLIPTRLGHLCTGQLKNPPAPQKENDNVLLQVQHSEEGNTLPIQDFKDELDKWDQYWALYVQVDEEEMNECNQHRTLECQVHACLTEDSETDENEAVKWEQFWTLESAGTEEFTNSAKMEKALTDQHVWKTFNKTIEKD